MGPDGKLPRQLKQLSRMCSDGRLNPDKIDDCLFAQYLTTAYIPDPELLIRTSGEKRISNFLLFQMAYTELYFTEVLWPIFAGKICTGQFVIFKAEKEDSEKLVNSVNRGRGICLICMHSGCSG